MALVGWLTLAGVWDFHGVSATELSPEAPSSTNPTPAQPQPATSKAEARTYPLVVAERWLLNSPGGQRLDASALLRQTNGTLFLVNDKSPGLFRIELRTNETADLVRDPAWFTPAQLSSIAHGKIGRWDLEGISQDSSGRIYFCEEQNRWVLRADPRNGRLERLEIDWRSVRKWFSEDSEASWEGIAVGSNGLLYLANERSVGRIVVVDLSNLKVVDSFQVSPLGRPARNVMYSDLCWFEGELWVLCRQSRRVLRVNPATHRVLADFDYTAIELSPEHGYITPLPYGQFEGLAVEAANIWLLIDTNGSGRAITRNDRRPSLFRCRRPDRN